MLGRAGLLATLALAACGSGGGAGPGTPEQAIWLGIVRADTPTEVEVEVANPVAANAMAEEAAGPGGPFAPAPGTLPVPVAAGSVLTLRVVFTPGAPGVSSGQIRLRFVGGGDEREIVLRLTATVETPDFRLLTTTLAFPATFIGEKRSLDIRVRNASQLTAMAMTAISAPPPDFVTNFQPGTLAAGDTATIRVTYEPTAPRIFDFQIEIANNLGVPLRVRVTARADRWVAEQVIDLGTVGFTQGNTTAWLEVNLPAVAISLSIEALGASSTNAGLLGLEGPGGKVYETAQGTGPFRWYPAGSGVFAATLPGTDDPNVQLVPGGGTYRFRLYRASGTGTSLQVRAIIENRDGLPTNQGQLDLNVFLAPGLGITSPETDAKLQDIIARVDELYAQAGLAVGETSFYLLENGDYDVIGPGELPDLLAESSAAPEVRANIFFVQDISGGAFGVAGAIPGPKRNGTGTSGVMVDYDFGDAATVGLVAAHEIGHLVGLYHTTESDGSYDTITDTTQCPVSNTNCANYLMQWKVLGSVITPGQAQVILAHPLVDPPPASLAGLSALAQRRPPAPVFVELPPDFCRTCAGH